MICKEFLVHLHKKQLQAEKAIHQYVFDEVVKPVPMGQRLKGIEHSFEDNFISKVVEESKNTTIKIGDIVSSNFGEGSVIGVNKNGSLSVIVDGEKKVMIAGFCKVVA